MLLACGCRHVIVGHSERRQYFGETDATVNRRLKAALAAKLEPIVCLGETLDERKREATKQVLRTQFAGAFASLSAQDLATATIAYEPVWAIGKGVNATPQQAQEAQAFIRALIREQFGEDSAGRMRIQYGGSVKPSNARELLAQPDVDGALVGGASLAARDFAGIVKAAP
jgi:triosephosphate isomerase